MYILRSEPNLEPPPYHVPMCPACGCECGIYYLDINRDVIMCDECFDGRIYYEEAVNAWEEIG